MQLVETRFLFRTRPCVSVVVAVYFFRHQSTSGDWGRNTFSLTLQDSFQTSWIPLLAECLSIILQLSCFVGNVAFVLVPSCASSSLRIYLKKTVYNSRLLTGCATNKSLTTKSITLTIEVAFPSPLSLVVFWRSTRTV